ncbi:MAG: Gfo/Idh/MocA family oxidoreductase [Chloroflexi bacterium]|nr:MAG: Gfo/Idh/MocA family oxidoreductase [Chloroflexota bacterium]
MPGDRPGARLAIIAEDVPQPDLAGRAYASDVSATSVTIEPRWAVDRPPNRKLRFGIVGCGDVAHRRYLPALSEHAAGVEVVACCDSQPGAAERAVHTVDGWSPRATAYTDLAAMLEQANLDATINLTPAPLHASVSQACLEAGVPVFSEKPIAATLAEADRLIHTASARDLLLLCAPAIAATRRFQWLNQIVASQRYGPLTLVVAQYADPGPAAWREYTGDPTPFYGAGVGPVVDHGIYRLHAMTALMGPVRRVQAMGAIGKPERVVRGGPLAGATIPVTAPDHVLMNLEFVGGGLGQLLSSSATASTLAPWLELHFTGATMSFPGDQYDKDSSASLYLDDDSALGLEGWVHGIGLPPPLEARPVVETGVAHFVACLRGEEKPLLTAEHARHVLDVILKGYESVRDGRSHDTETTF